MKIFAQGLDRLMDAIEAEAEAMFGGDIEEIGSSDVSIAVMGALGSMGIKLESLSAEERGIVRNGMLNAINKVRARYNERAY